MERELLISYIKKNDPSYREIDFGFYTKEELQFIQARIMREKKIAEKYLTIHNEHDVAGKNK